jgi:dephospho-CoA kinase
MLRETLPGFRAVLGLAGGVGTGKSTCRAWLAARGALCVDCDRLAHACYAPGGPAYAAVAALFPSALEAPGGAVDRRRLGELVFGDAAARSALNAAVWPALRGMVVAELAAAAAAAGAEGGLVGVVEAAILLEAGWGAQMDGVWLLDVPREAALARLQGSRGLSAAAAEARVAAQPTAAERLASPAGACVTRVIDTGGEMAATEALYEAAWRDFLAQPRAAAAAAAAASGRA